MMFPRLWLVSQICVVLALQHIAKNVCSTCEIKNGSMDCSSRNLSALPMFENVPNIVNLSFAYNLLVRVTQLQKLPVKILSFAHNEIQSIDEAAFKNLAYLSNLDLSYNLFTSDTLLPNSFKGNYAADLYEPLRYLKELNLAYNQLHTLHPDIFEHTPNLEILKVNGNPLKIITQGMVIAISSIPNLKELDLSLTSLRNLPENLLHAPKHLEVLNLANNLLTEPPNELENSHRLRWLSLNENPIKEIKKFPNLPFLKTLHLCKMPRLESIEGRSLSDLPLLEEFYCSDNRRLVKIEKTVFSAKHDGEEEGETWPPLKVVILNNNSLSTIDRHLISRWDRVKILNLQNNPWMCDCESQWMVSVLTPILEKTQPEMLISLKCVKPSEMNDTLIVDLSHRNYQMRCLDLYNHTPEKDTKLLINICIFAMISAPFLMAFALYYKRNQRRTRQIFLRSQDYSSYSQLKLFPLEKETRDSLT